MRRLLRELSVFMLAGLLLGSIGAMVYSYGQLKKRAQEQAKAIGSNKRHHAWIYVDIAQEFDGNLVTRPKVPPQIAAMVNAGKECEVGSKTFGEDNVEWICVEPIERFKWMDGDVIINPDGMVPIPKGFTLESSTPPLPPGYKLDPPPTQDSPKITSIGIDYKALGFESLAGGACGFLLGIPVWLFSRLVRFAIKG
jgi:hypothetical protein